MNNPRGVVPAHIKEVTTMARMQTLEISQTNIRVGDILYDTTNYYSVRPYFFKVVGFKGKKTVLLEEMQKAFQTRYYDNSPAYLCMPAEKRTDEFPFVMDWVSTEKAEGKAYESKFFKGEPFRYVLTILDWGTRLYLKPWNGEPVDGCCD